MASKDHSASPMPVIGLVGGIGAGKSTVADELGRLGCEVIDADRIGHQLLDEPDVRRRIVDRWGPAVLDAAGQVDRKALGQTVFAEPDQLQALNEIMTPRITEQIVRRLDPARDNPDVPAVVLDAAILLEAGWDRLCTDLVFVRADASARRGRVVDRRGWDEQTWRQREKSQISLDRKADRCCHVVDNSSSVSRLREQVLKLFHDVVPS
jgi:dephospho-CoA kinase